MVDEKKGVDVITRYFENDTIKIEFTIEDGFITSIDILIKEDEMFSRIDFMDTRRAFAYLNNFAQQISQTMANVPTGTPPGNEASIDIKPDACPRCKSDRISTRGACCGGRGELLQCNECGMRMRFVPK